MFGFNITPEAIVWRIMDVKILKCQTGFIFKYCDMTLCHSYVFAKCNVISIMSYIEKSNTMLGGNWPIHDFINKII